MLSLQLFLDLTLCRGHHNRLANKLQQQADKETIGVFCLNTFHTYIIYSSVLGNISVLDKLCLLKLVLENFANFY
jgi:hypothetical protein